MYTFRLKTMEDFLLRGSFFQNREIKLKLKLPLARKYKMLTVNDTDEISQPSKLIREAVRMRKETLRNEVIVDLLLFKDMKK